MQDCLQLPGKCFDIASCVRENDNDEVRRYRRNWIVLHTTTFLMGTTFSIVLSSQHQFITNPRYPEDPNEDAGLGENEVFYSLTIGIFSIGELISSLVVSVLSSWHIKMKHLMLFGLLLLASGGWFYALAQYGWMVLVGRFLQGLHLGGQSVLMRVYFGETSNTVRDILRQDPEKSQIKNTNFMITFILGTVGMALGPGFAALVVQISLVDEFRWSGWYYVFHGTIQMLIVLVLFKENWSDLKRASVNCKRLSILSGIAVPLYCIVFLIVAFFVVNCWFGSIETLQNPILSDNFGMNVKWGSYTFFVSLFFFPLSIILIIVMQRCGLSNHYIFLLGILTVLTGCMLMTDWQAIGGDPCDQFSGSCNNQTAVVVNRTELDMFSDSNNASVLLPCEVCRMHSGEPYQCFFNPDGRISHEYCSDCRPFCRSKHHTLYFPQFLIGVCLYGLGFPFMRTTLSIIFSDSLGSASQSLMMGLLICSGALARSTAPLWSDAAYVAANHRTYSPMLLLAGMLFVILVIYIILFKRLKPYHIIQNHYDTSDGDVVELVPADHNKEEIIESEVTAL